MKNERNVIIPPIVQVASVLQLDLIRSEMSSGEASVRLSPKELGVLIFLINSRKPRTIKQVIDRVWKGNGNERNVWITMSRLRTKLKRIGLADAMPLWQTGYSLDLSALNRKKT